MKNIWGNGYIDEMACMGAFAFGALLVYLGRTQEGVMIVSAMLGYVFGRGREIRKK